MGLSPRAWLRGTPRFTSRLACEYPKDLDMTITKSIASSTLALIAFSTLLYPVQSYAKHCDSDQWLSQSYRICFDKDGRCDQYNFTDSETCNSGQDNIRCDWDSEFRVCYPEKEHCSPSAWYSERFDRCFDKHGCCDQYDYTDSQTCNSGHDALLCDWDPHTGLCRPEQAARCDAGQWYSQAHDRCFDKNGPCIQYHRTDAETCHNAEDNIRCRWNPHRLHCLPRR